MTQDVLLWVLVGITMLFGVLLYVARWKMFEKAFEDGWKSLVPVLNICEMFKMANMNPWLVLLLVVPLVNVVVLCIFAFKFSKAFGFGLLGSLSFIFFTNFVIYYIGFSKKVIYKVPGQ